MEFTRENWDKTVYYELLQALRLNGDQKVKQFSEKLIPNAKNIIGLKIPDLRKIATKIAGGNYDSFLAQENTGIYEETLLRGLVITKIKANLQDILPYIAAHIPQIDNWALCDTFCSGLKQAKKDLATFFEFLKPYYESDNPWEIRTALISYLSFFINDKYIDEILHLSGDVKSDHYYVQMGNAWLLSVCYVKYPEKTLQFLKTTNLDDFTYNKAIQKMIESYRIDNEAKKMLRAMKRRVKKV